MESVAAKFKTRSTLSATMSGHGGTRMNKKENGDGSHRKCDLFHKIIIQ